MKHLLIAFILTTGFAYADDDKKEESIEQRKTHITANIDKRIASLNTLKGCVQAASSKDAMKACRKAHKDEMKKLHEENKEWKDEKKEGREEKRKNKKDKKANKEKSN